MKKWRKAKAAELGKPPYVVFTDATLNEIAKKRPHAVSQMVGISGIGEKKLEHYGADVVGLIHKFEDAAAGVVPEPDEGFNGVIANDSGFGGDYGEVEF